MNFISEYTRTLVKELVGQFSKDPKALADSLSIFIPSVPPSLAASCERPSEQDVLKLFTRYEPTEADTIYK